MHVSESTGKLLFLDFGFLIINFIPCYVTFNGKFTYLAEIT